MEYMRSLWKGDIPLWKTFWLFGVVGVLVLSYAIDWLNLAFIKNIPGASIYFVYALSVLSLVYLCFVLVAIWKSATKYVGLRAWSNLSKFVVVSVVSVNVYFFYLMATIDTNDPGKDSSNIESVLHYDDNYPYVGFWKGRCSEGFGLSIDKAGDGLYSISFCGPGGCFKPGTYRPNTTLVDDPNYRIINEDEIEVKGRDGFSKYHRCGL